MLKIALFQPDIAPNVGTIIRTCACLNVEVHIIEPCGFVFDIQKIKRAAMDYINHVKLVRHDSFEDFIKSQENHRIILLTTKTKKSYLDFQFQKDDILMLGRESAGVPKEVSDLIKNQVTIKMTGKVRSLNVAISASIVLSEAIRQCNKRF